MRVSIADFPALGKTLLAVLAMLATGAASLHFSIAASATAERALAAARSARDEFDGKLRSVRGEEDEIRQKSALFEALKARGAVGDERRLDWVELLREVGDRRRIIDLRYELAPQRRLDERAGGPFEFHASAMKLQMQLLHEEDLTRVLADLSERAPALVKVRTCSLTRLAPATASGEAAAALRGECQIDWVTLGEAAARKGERR